MGALGDDVALSAFLSDWQPKFVGFTCRKRGSTGLDLFHRRGLYDFFGGGLRSKMPYMQVLATGRVSEGLGFRSRLSSCTM